MNIEKRRAFIINFLYFSIFLSGAFLAIKYVLPMFSPFVTAFLIAFLLRRPIESISEKTPLPRKPAAILVVLLFFCTIGLFFTLLGIQAFSSARLLVANLPEIYTRYVEPAFVESFDQLEQLLLRIDLPLLSGFEELKSQFVKSAGQMVSNLSIGAMGSLSGLASSLPGSFLKLLLTVISAFFIAADYDKLTGFCLSQLSERRRRVLLQIKEYIVGTLFVCIRSYSLIMSITFVELSVGLTVIGVKRSLLIALMISLFDILPVLGTGGIMIPWTVITALQGDYPLALGLLAVYLFITVIRNILEPKIVGSQIGLHPLVTLVSMFVGMQVFGVLGLFGFPIGLSLLRHLVENGTIRPGRHEEEERSPGCGN